MSTITATSTDIELDCITNRQSATGQNDTQLPATDDVVEASRIVDAGVPEGGYGWIALAGCGVICFWFIGVCYCWGVIQAALVKDRLSTVSTISWIGSLNAAIIAFLAILSARVLRSIGSQRTALLGTFLLGFSEILTGFCVDNVAGLFVTFGVTAGIGSSLSFNVVASVPAQYFNRKRGLANGIVFACGGLGGAAISFAMDGLIQKLGTAWAFRVLGIITLATGLPAAWFVRDRAPPTRRTFIEWQLFKDFRFLVLLLAGAVATFPLFVPPFFLPLYATSLGLSSNKGAALVAVFNFSSAMGRIGSGILADHFGALNTLTASLALNGLSVLVIWPVSHSLGALIAFSIINGAAAGGFFSLMPTVASRVFGSARVSIAFGMLVTSWSAGYLLGAPIAGYILAAYGGHSNGLKAYRPAMYYAGSMALGAAGLVALVRFRMSAKLAKRL